MENGKIKFIYKSKFDVLGQKVKDKIIEAWEPTFGDILYNSKYNHIVLINEDFINNGCTDKKELIELHMTPLFTTGQLMDLIEVITGTKMDIDYCINDYDIYLFSEITRFVRYSELGNDINEALWTVLIKEIEKILED